MSRLFIKSWLVSEELSRCRLTYHFVPRRTIVIGRSLWCLFQCKRFPLIQRWMIGCLFHGLVVERRVSKYFIVDVLLLFMEGVSLRIEMNRFSILNFVCLRYHFTLGGWNVSSYVTARIISFFFLSMLFKTSFWQGFLTFHYLRCLRFIFNRVFFFVRYFKTLDRLLHNFTFDFLFYWLAFNFRLLFFIMIIFRRFSTLDVIALWSLMSGFKGTDFP